MIFEELHNIQNNPANHGHLPEADLRSLAKRTGRPLYRLQEVASFFPHFRLKPGPKVDVRVCRDMSCHLHGADDVAARLAGLTKEFSPDQLTVQGVSCLGRCDRGPIVCVNHNFFSQQALTHLPETIRQTVAGKAPHHDDDPELSFVTPEIWKIDPYQEACDFQAVRNFIMNPDSQRFLQELKTAALLGMGGAGTPAVQKWTDVWQAVSPDDEKYVVCNGDESEPGTFKDRELLLHKPHLVVEGVILAGMVVGATRGYIFIRHEYPEQVKAVRASIAEAEKRGVCGAILPGWGRPFLLEVFVSPGGYICGEQGALIETIEGNRAQPRNRPPQLETNGLFNKPTLLSNVETYAWAPAIALHGGKWYADQGVGGSKGLRFFSISGDVKRPGAYEVPIGLPLGTLINDLAGGTLDGKLPAAIAGSGPSGGFIPPRVHITPRAPEALKAKADADGTLDAYDLPLDLGVFRQLDLALGAGIVIYGHDADMLDQALNCTQFFRNETCGKCVPCRIGTQKLTEIADQVVRSGDDTRARSGQRELVAQLASAMAMTSICGLGVAAPILVSWLKYFDPTPSPTVPPKPAAPQAGGGSKPVPKEGAR